MSDKFRNLEIQHTAYNAQRTLRNENPSQFKISDFEGMLMLKDSEIAFANQIWGLNQHSVMHLREALLVYDEMSMSPYLDVNAVDQTETLQTELKKLGFETVETLNFLTLKLADIEITPPKLEVERLDNQAADAFLDLLKTSGMQTTQTIWQAKKKLYCTDTFRCFVAKIDGIPHALATTFVDGQYGFLANAFTQPDFQNNGCQTALLQARLNDAKEMGLSAVIVDVVPQTSSERNCKKMGFEWFETRYIWQKKPLQTKSPT